MILNEQYVKDLIKCVDIGLLLGAPIEDNDDSLLSIIGTDLMAYYNKYIQTLPPNLSIKQEPKLFAGDINLKNAVQVESLNLSEVDEFYSKHFLARVPVKLLGCMIDWPANKKWKDWNYFIHTCGERTVPVEIGSHYAHENWSQKLMTLREFITNYLGMDYNADDPTRGYLAQHNLFNQV